MVDLLMLTKSLSGIEGLRTWLARIEVCFCALEWLLVLVYRHDVSLQCVLLSECLIAALVSSTPVSLLAFVSFHVSPQPRTGKEDLVASVPGAFVVSLLGVCTLDVVLKVGVSEVVFGAASVRTFEGAHVVVRSEVLFELDRSVECFVTIVPGALQSLFATGRLELGCRCGWSRNWGLNEVSVEVDLVATLGARHGIVRDMLEVIIRVRSQLHVAGGRRT